VDGELNVTGLSAPVEVFRDEFGIPYIFADNLPDLITAQGFIMAQHRLAQIVPLKRMMNGRLAEIIGEAGLTSDVTMRTLGIRQNAERHLTYLSAESRQFLQYYVDGVNAYIQTRQDEFPVELALMGLEPELWKPIDIVTIMHFISYSHSVNYKTELIAQELINRLGVTRATELFPVNISPDRSVKPRIDAGLSAQNTAMETPLSIKLTIAENLPGLPQLGSNNWAVGKQKSASGGATMSNDPHVDARSLPGLWHPQGLFCPEVSAIGVSIPGLPGLITGRTEHIAFGVTNAYGDVQDLYIETIDANNKDHYLEGEISIPFSVRRESILIKDDEAPTGFREHNLTIRSTRRGPIISEVLDNVSSQQVISLRWMPAELSGTEIGVDRLLTARNVSEADEAIQDIDVMMFNWALADADGNIGRRSSGLIPTRMNSDGTQPVRVQGSLDNWSGFIPKNEMPGMFNPAQNWVGTSNHDIRLDDFPYYYSSYFSPSYRYRRLHQLMSADDSIDVNDHFNFMQDNRNLQVDALLPAILEVIETRTELATVSELLSSWDGTEDKTRAAPLIYHEIYRQLAFETFVDELGEKTSTAMLGSWYFWQERFDVLLSTPGSHWFDDQRTPAMQETLDDMILRACEVIMTRLSARFGADPNQWKWGDTHSITYSTTLAQSGIIWRLLGGQSFPMSGSAETLNRAGYSNDGEYEVGFSDSLRFVADMGDPDKVEAILPGGVVSRIFNPHFKDQLEIFHRGERIPWWFSRSSIEEHAKHHILLKPGSQI
jgi:penicillin amidase